MKIVENANLIDSLLSSHRKITLSCDNENKGMLLLNDIEIELTTKPHYDASKKTLTVTLRETTEELSFSHIPESARSVFEEVGLDDASVRLPDFKGSNQFYAEISKGSSPIKVVSDQFSTRRGARLFEMTGQIELALRDILYKDGRGLLESRGIRPQNIRSKSPDDPMAQYNLTEILEKYLLQLSSDSYYLSKLDVAEDDRDSIAARNSVILDELEVPVGQDEFKKYIKIRNAIMHFKVVTIDDAQTLISIHEKLLQYNFTKAMQGIADRGFEDSNLE